MSSRLDRLFVLLESSSSSATRLAAAKQLGQVQKMYPHELHTLLRRITYYLKSSSWDTRVAAAQAVAAVLTATPKWQPQIALGDVKPVKLDRFSLHELDIDGILEKGKALMGAESKMYDGVQPSLNQQKARLESELGLDSAAQLGLDISDIFTSDDLAPTSSTSTDTKLAKQPIAEVMMENASKTLSSRERNRARRKARQAFSKQRSRDSFKDEAEYEVERKRLKLETGVDDKMDAKAIEGVENVPDVTGQWLNPAGEWPFEAFYSSLCNDLFSVSWEVRHGAATALRELIRTHGDTAGNGVCSTVEELEAHHQAWLEDVATRLLCILALDRFGDFVTDAVVAPVRETAAQCLGACVMLMRETSVRSVLNALTLLLNRDEWETRHGGLLGVKYLLAVKEDLVHDLLSVSFPHILRGLSDGFDDVSAVAAAALIPVTSSLVRMLPDSILPVVLKLWDLLTEQDELTGACNSYMRLLAGLLSHPETTKLLPCMLEYVPRLWPFLSHNTSTVRRATLQTLRTLTLPKSQIDNVMNGSNVHNSYDKTGDLSLNWTVELLQDAMRHIFQRILVENEADIQNLGVNVWRNLLNYSRLDQLLHAACPFVSQWICMTMQPVKMPFDIALFIQSRSLKEPKNTTNTSILYQSDKAFIEPHNKYYLGGSETIPLDQRERNVTRCRTFACQMLGTLSKYIVQPAPGVQYTPEMESPIQSYVNVLLVYLQSKSALQRTVVALILCEWAKVDAESMRPCPDGLRMRLLQVLGEFFYYDEIAVAFTRVLQETTDFVALLKHYKIDTSQITQPTSSVLTLEKIISLTNDDMSKQIQACRAVNTKQRTVLEERKKSINNTASSILKDQNKLHVTTLACLSSACVWLGVLPDKLGPIIRPLIEALKNDEDSIIQEVAAGALTRVLDMCLQREPNPCKRVVQQLTTLLMCDEDFTPKILDQQFDGIVTLMNRQKVAERPALKRTISNNGLVIDAEDVEKQSVDGLRQIQRRGVTLAFKCIAEYFGAELDRKIPDLWDVIYTNLVANVRDSYGNTKLMNDAKFASTQLTSLQVLEVCVTSLNDNVLPSSTLDTLLNSLVTLLRYNYRAIRHLAARCLAAFARIRPVTVMTTLVEAMTMLDATTYSEITRQGVIEAISCIVDALRFEIVPYVVLLIVPLLGRMSDQDRHVRLMATCTFAELVQLLPLDGAVPEPCDLPERLRVKRDAEREFLRQLLSPSTIPDYKIPFEIKVKLRGYQQAGINWLAFLNKYKLHGILCDDMGLGKTLQSICMLASDHYHRQKKYDETKNEDFKPLPSIVICPPTLTGHWVYEIEKYLPAHANIRPLQYAGSPMERERLQGKLRSYNLFVASYDIVRKDIGFFARVRWNYCILDEGHVIKNGKTKSSQAIKTLTANHRLILSGTPIQNNVIELWSLFDFLMPGFLGTEKQFTQRYSRPILNSRDPKSSAKEQEQGVFAMESLHRQVLPFLLRRMKEDVLDDLPPKITQDYICELSPLQEQLYEDFSKSQAHQQLQESLRENGASGGCGSLPTHVFQVLRYLQNVCNHPKIVLKPSHPMFENVMQQLARSGVGLDDISHSAKLPALKQLLIDLGIGTSSQSTDVLSQHRALIFCQMKTMLDIIEHDLFKTHLPDVTYFRMDGSVPPNQRHDLVQKFNNDPSIDVMLLTTQVGGMGLNLTGADTVIFVEHDWNPMRDLQAMDRAHRIGQRKVVNVYRLITKHTLEQKIMGLQRFKLLTANTVINSENSSLSAMGSVDLLDLFTNQNDNKKDQTDASENSSRNNKSGSLKNILDGLPTLWDQNQYEDEYDVASFVENLKQ